MTWTTVTLQVATPLFNGGADLGIAGEEKAGLRPASVRGVMRFWFRAMAGAMTGPDLPLLAALEHQVFGGVGSHRDRGETAVSSPLVLRIPSPPHPSRQLNLPQGRNAAQIGYLMGLGLMRPGPGGLPLLERPCVAPGTTFELKLRFQHRPGTAAREREATEALALASLWLACTYGGFGARTHRGFGGVRITGVAGDLPAGWRPEWLKTPSLGVYGSTGRPWPWLWPQFGVFQQHLPELIRAETGAQAGPLDIWPKEPPFPVLSTAYSPAVLAKERFDSWQDALAYAGRQLRLFRANRPRKNRDRGIRSAEWGDVICGGGTHFPLGALGLPVAFHDKRNGQGFTVNAASPDLAELRRASPLWLRPVGSEDNWGLFTFAFRTRFLPSAAQVRVVPDNVASTAGERTKNVHVGQEDVDSLTREWLETMRDGRSFIDVIRGGAD